MSNRYLSIRKWRMLRETRNQRRYKAYFLLVSLFIVTAISVIAANIFADIITDSDVEVRLNSRLTYYLTVQEDGIDVDGVESSDTQMANLTSGRISVTDRIPDGLIFQGFVTTSNGKIGASSRADSSIACSGVVVDDTNESIVDAGTWNNDHTAYYYHGLHYDVASRTVSFKVEKLKAGCELTVGIITKTPSVVDDPDTQAVETRRDFFNNALASEKDLTSISNTVHAYIESTETVTYPVTYSYTGDIPAGAPDAPTAQSYPANASVSVVTSPTLAGYTFSGWTTTDATVADGSFAMPEQAVNFVGIWTKDIVVPTYTVTYVIDGVAPADYLAPAPRSYPAGGEVSLDELQANATIDGYRFSGWTTTDATIAGSGFTMPTSDVTIHGSFTRISYTVCYEFEGSILPPNAESLLPACANHYPGDTVTTAANPTAEGYEFVGWYKNATFTMPEKNVVIYGEWGLAPAGKFSPTLTKVILNNKDEYMYGETVEFKITITNTAEYPIHDVYVSELLDGAVIDESPNSSYSIIGNSTASISSIATGASVDIFAHYQVQQNESQTLTNTVKLTGALADNNNVLDQSQEYIASVTFTTVAEPAPLTGIIFNPVIYIGMIAIAAITLLARVLLSGKHRLAASAFRHIQQCSHIPHIRFCARNAKRIPIRIACGALAMLLIASGVIHNVIAEEYTEIIKSVSLTSAHASYENNEGGAWNVTKSAEWISNDTARITFDVDTIMKIRDNSGLDVVLVIDTSGSMAGRKIEQMKSDAAGLAEEIINNHNGRVAVVNFSTAATIQSELTNNISNLNNAISNLTATGDTNYNAGLTKAGEVLEEYQSQPDRKLTLLFLTDGFPNLDTPNEEAAYRILKANHPNMLISGIQYEMDSDILEPVKNISDQQFVADMTTLDNVLVSSLYEPVVFGDFVLTDYINNDYWEVADSSSINATAGEFELNSNSDGQYITWDLSDEFGSGAAAELTIDIQLKDNTEYNENTYLPTNTHESVVSTMVDVANENVDSTATPVLKAKYKVTYDANLPSGCSAYSGTLPQNGTYTPLSVVLVPADPISCDGYNFVGWQDANGSADILNGEYVRIRNNDLDFKAVWSKVSIKKTMDGAVHGGSVARLDNGVNINIALKELTGQTITEHTDPNDDIKAIKSASSMSAAQMANARDISSPDSEYPIYAWFDGNDGTIYIYSEASTIKGNPDMSELFYAMGELSDASGIADWDMSETTSIRSAFASCGFRDLDFLADWDVSNVEDMAGMLYINWQLEDISGLANWNTSSLTNMWGTFSGVERVEDLSPLANWDVSNVTDMGYAFYGVMSAQSLDPLANWDVGNVEAMDHMFGGTRTITDVDGLANWDTSKVVWMHEMFRDTPSLTDLQGLANWDVSNVVYMQSMFRESGITNVDGLANWNTGKVELMTSMFGLDRSLEDISGLANWDTSSVTNMHYMFSETAIKDVDALSNWDTSNVLDMSDMFSAVTLLNVDGLARWDTGKVENMHGMFYGTPGLGDISGLTNWNVSSVTDMSEMFKYSGFTNIGNLSNWNTGNVTDMSHMFEFVINHGFTDISGASGWDVSKVTDMSYMFANDGAIASLTVLDNWDTSSVLEKGNMFLNIPDTIQRPRWWGTGS